MEYRKVHLLDDSNVILDKNISTSKFHYGVRNFDKKTKST